jgi:hypothetical protein
VDDAAAEREEYGIPEEFKPPQDPARNRNSGC